MQDKVIKTFSKQPWQLFSETGQKATDAGGMVPVTTGSQTSRASAS